MKYWLGCSHRLALSLCTLWYLETQHSPTHWHILLLQSLLSQLHRRGDEECWKADLAAGKCNWSRLRDIVRNATRPWYPRVPCHWSQHSAAAITVAYWPMIIGTSQEKQNLRTKQGNLRLFGIRACSILYCCTGIYLEAKSFVDCWAR